MSKPVMVSKQALLNNIHDCLRAHYLSKHAWSQLWYKWKIKVLLYRWKRLVGKYND